VVIISSHNDHTQVLANGPGGYVTSNPPVAVSVVPSENVVVTVRVWEPDARPETRPPLATGVPPSTTADSVESVHGDPATPGVHEIVASPGFAVATPESPLAAPLTQTGGGGGGGPAIVTAAEPTDPLVTGDPEVV
jgi:hypothetical protein